MRFHRNTLMFMRVWSLDPPHAPSTPPEPLGAADADEAQSRYDHREATMNNVARTAPMLWLWVSALIAVVVSVDILFFRNHFWERLMVNIGIVLLFGSFYLRFMKHP
jgi:hypothetical protein